MKEQIKFYNYLRNTFRNGNHKESCPEYLSEYYKIEDSLSDKYRDKAYYAMSDFIYLGIAPKLYLFEACQEWGKLVVPMAKMRCKIESNGKI